MPTQQDVITVLKTIFDPEIPVDIYELGLIYEVKFSDAEGGQKVDVQMTLTSPNCPVAESLPNDVKQKVASMEGVVDADVEVVFEPAWTQDMMSEEAKLNSIPVMEQVPTARPSTPARAAVWPSRTDRSIGTQPSMSFAPSPAGSASKCSPRTQRRPAHRTGPGVQAQRRRHRRRGPRPEGA